MQDYTRTAGITYESSSASFRARFVKRNKPCANPASRAIKFSPKTNTATTGDVSTTGSLELTSGAAGSTTAADTIITGDSTTGTKDPLGTTGTGIFPTNIYIYVRGVDCHLASTEALVTGQNIVSGSSGDNAKSDDSLPTRSVAAGFGAFAAVLLCLLLILLVVLTRRRRKKEQESGYSTQTDEDVEMQGQYQKAPDPQYAPFFGEVTTNNAASPVIHVPISSDVSNRGSWWIDYKEIEILSQIAAGSYGKYGRAE